jgi:hypothetical protein
MDSGLIGIKGAYALYSLGSGFERLELEAK